MSGRCQDWNLHSLILRLHHYTVHENLEIRSVRSKPQGGKLVIISSMQCFLINSSQQVKATCIDFFTLQTNFGEIKSFSFCSHKYEVAKSIFILKFFLMFLLYVGGALAYWSLSSKKGKSFGSTYVCEVCVCYLCVFNRAAFCVFVVSLSDYFGSKVRIQLLRYSVLHSREHMV